MAYTKTTWVEGNPPGISASNLNKIEQGIYDAHQQLGTVNQQLNTLNQQLGTKVAKAGDTMTGNLTFDARSSERQLIFNTGRTTYLFGRPSDGVVGFHDTSAGTLLVIDPANNRVSVSKPLVLSSYLQLPVLSSDPSNPPNGAIWMRA